MNLKKSIDFNQKTYSLIKTGLNDTRIEGETQLLFNKQRFGMGGRWLTIEAMHLCAPNDRRDGFKKIKSNFSIEFDPAEVKELITYMQDFLKDVEEREQSNPGK